jgi:succinate dehydrogenase / fumarate reductase membrane anchor subunit
MVTNITSLGGNGTADWLVQRVSAVVLLAWIFCVGGSVLFTDGMTYETWSSLFDTTAMRVFSLVALLSLCAHAWIGMWTISTDYLTTALLGKSATAVRLLFQLACLLVLFTYFVWGIQILWSV